MTTTEDLYQQALRLTERPGSLDRDVKDIVDLALDARPDRQPWEVLREAANLLGYHHYPQAATSARSVANHLEAKHRAAQEAAAAEAEREKLIEQGDPIFREAWLEADRRGESGGRVKAGLRALADAGFLTNPDTPCCRYPDVCHECASYADEADPEAVTE